LDSTNICESFRGLRKFLDIQINRRDAMDAEAVIIWIEAEFPRTDLVAQA